MNLTQEIVNEKLIELGGNMLKPLKVDHSIGRRQAFLRGGTKTNRGLISKRGKQMAIHLGLIKGDSE